MMNLQSERRFRALIEKSRDAVLLVNANSNITYANRSVGEQLGYTPEAVMALSMVDLVHPVDSNFLEDNLVQNEDETNKRIELRLHHHDGTWRWFEATMTNLLDDPAVECILLTLRDITDHKEAQRALQSQRDLLMNIVAISQATSERADLNNMLYNLVKIGKQITLANSGSVFLFDQYGALIFCNSYHGRLDSDHVEHLLKEGLSGWVIKNKRPALIVDTKTDERWLEFSTNSYTPRSALAVPIQENHKVQAILVLTHSQPNHFTTEHLNTLEAASGQLTLILQNARLYSEAKAKLADQSALIESSHDGFILINQHGQTRVINSAAINLMNIGQDPGEWINRPIINLLQKARHTCPKLVKIMIGEFKRIRNGDVAAAAGEVNLLTQSLKWAHMPVNANNQNMGRLIVLRDMTEQRNLEHQREELTDMIVHDLRNPASAVSGIVSMLKTLKVYDQIPEDYDQMVRLAERNVNKLLDLIQEILDVSQLENGLLPVSKTQFPIDRAIEETLQLQRPIISMKDMTLETNIQPGMPQVWADERLIRRVLQNLVDNAAKFSRRNTSIRITAKISSENPNWIQVSVQDHGVGIPIELQSRVFEKFVTNRQTERGSGIGLTFCRLAVLAHEGQIWAESEENFGSTFHFTLPIYQPENN